MCVSNAGKYDSICNNNDDDEILSKLKLIFSKYKKKRICNRSKIYRGLIFKRCNIHKNSKDWKII